MTVKEYFEKYNEPWRAYDKTYSAEDDCKTIDNLYNKCIKDTMLDKNRVLQWHEMLMEYANKPDAIFWIRYHESGKKVFDPKLNKKRYSTRRACLTKFNNLSYVFVSNYDAHEIFNMVSKSFVDVPTADEFLEMMKNFTYHLHYDKGTSCEESDIASYPAIGNVRGGVLTEKKWYLAHIFAVKGEYKRSSGLLAKLSKAEVSELYPRGVVPNWDSDGKGHYIRRIAKDLSPEEMKIVKAHFLRFVHPMNYFLVPGVKHEYNDIYKDTEKSIGELSEMTRYMADRMYEVYGAEYEKFLKEIMVEIPAFGKPDGSKVINIKYDPDADLKTGGGSGSKTPKPKKIKAPKVPVVRTPGGVGKYIKNELMGLLNAGKLSPAMIDQLRDKDYCSAELKLSYAALVETTDSFNHNKYYVDLVCGKYRICSQWADVNHNKEYFDQWKAKHGF